jgi:hypothetical protein
MLEPDFNNYSLALIKDDKILFSSTKSGLRPLVECVQKFKLKVSSCILHDKVIGLAAARIIVYSGMISHIKTTVCSKPAKEFLDKTNITLNSKKIVDNILDVNKSDMCPMEKRAIEAEDNKSFFAAMKKIFS